MSDYSVYTKEDFNDLNNYDLYGFYDDMNISDDEAAERTEAALNRSKELKCSDTYKLNSLQLFEKRDFIKRWTVKDSIELLSDETFHMLTALDPLERPKAENILRMQAIKFKCKTEFNKKLKVVEKSIVSCNMASMKPPDLPFIFINGIDIATGEPTYSINTALLADYVRNNFYYKFARDNAKGAILRYWYDSGSGVYKFVSDNEIKGYIDQIIKNFSPSMVKSSYSREAFELISHDDNYIPIEKAKADENIINFENGLLYLDTLELKPHTPLVFTTIQIPCNWKPDAPKAEVFSKYMYDLTNGRADVEKFLLEYIGLVISNISSKHFKKALIMYGAGDTGKSQLKKLTEMLIGNENAISIDLEALEKRFGTSAIYGKRLAGSADMSFVEVNELKVFKSLTGGDNIMIEYKKEGVFNGSYDVFLWFCTNELPRFGGDKGDHVYNRMALIECNNVIPPKKQDHNLLSKMYSEREGIVYMSVMAAREVVANGYKLDTPEIVFKNIEEYKVSNSSIAQFFYECCEINERPPKYGCETSAFVKTFRNWYMANVGRNPPSTQILNKELMKLADYDKYELIKKYDGNRFYQFILTKAAQGYMTE